MPLELVVRASCPWPRAWRVVTPFMECGSASYRREIEQGGSFAAALQVSCSWGWAAEAVSQLVFPDSRLTTPDFRILTAFCLLLSAY